MPNFMTPKQREELIIRLLLERDQLKADYKEACRLYYTLMTAQCAQDFRDLWHKVQDVETRLWGLGVCDLKD